MNFGELLDKFKYGLIEIIPEPLLAKLSGVPLKVKWGADPSAPDLHLGHYVLLLKLRLLQQMGHTIQFVIGDFTAMIGDPTGKSKTRPALTKAQVTDNAKTYQEQVFMVLDPNKTIVTFNSSWLDQLSSVEMVQLTSKYNVARMLEREDFNTRFSNNISISIHEFLYPLLQGYDSVALESDIEMGGSDQTFNLLMGRHLQQCYNQVPQGIMTVPILEGLDGKQKMSKSLNNHIALKSDSHDMFGKLMAIPDELIIKYFHLATLLPIPTIKTFESRLADGENPRNIKIQLAKTIVSQLHSETAAVAAEKRFDSIFSKRTLPVDDLPIIPYHSKKLSDFLVDESICQSKKEVGRLIKQGAISIDETPVDDVFFQLDPLTGDHTLKVGKKKFYKIVPHSES